ncbi:MAG: OmpW family outer membrane protein, partial [Bermanella sp.]
MLKKLNKSALILSASLLALPNLTMAYEAGELLMRVGSATVSPESKSDGIDQDPSQAVSANDNTQLGLSATYMLTDNLGLEILAASPFTHDIKAKGGTLDGASIGEAKQLPPTVTAQYYFLDSNSAIQPYAGVGLNFTVFFDEEIGNDAHTALGYDSLSLDNSTGLTAQVGIDYKVNQNVFVNASAMY